MGDVTRGGGIALVFSHEGIGHVGGPVSYLTSRISRDRTEIWTEFAGITSDRPRHMRVLLLTHWEYFEHTR